MIKLHAITSQNLGTLNCMMYSHMTHTAVYLVVQQTSEPPYKHCLMQSQAQSPDQVHTYVSVYLLLPSSIAGL